MSETLNIAAAAAEDTDHIPRHVWIISGVAMLGAVMSILDTTIVNVALATLGRQLHSSLADIQWVITGYMLALAAVIPVTGWASRRFGAKPLFLISLALFTLGSLNPPQPSQQRNRREAMTPAMASTTTPPRTWQRRNALKRAPK